MDLIEMNGSKFIEVLGAKIHYLDIGNGDPVLFLHGVPFSSYSWREIVPFLSNKARCIVPDLVGIGKSDKPKNIERNFFQHAKYLESFIDQLGLEHITFVGYGLGAELTFDYASSNSKNTKAIAFHESHIRSEISCDHLSTPLKLLQYFLQTDPENAYKAVVHDEAFVDKWFYYSGFRDLDEEIKQDCRLSFSRPENREVYWQYIQDFSINEKGCRNVSKSIEKYTEYLQSSSIPKLMFYSVPGFITTIDTVNWCSGNIPNLQLVDLEESNHLTNPKMFGNILSDWYVGLSAES